MKKLLFVLLIAFAVSTTVQTEDFDLEGWWQNICGFVASLSGEARKIYNWLKSHGYWDKILSTALSGQAFAAINLCTGYTGQDSLCSGLINGIAA